MPALSDAAPPVSLPPTTRIRPIAMLTLALTGSAALMACADQRQPGFYDVPRDNTVSDAQIMGTDANSRNVVRAPSQLQIDLRPTTPTQQQQLDAQQQRAIQEGRTTEDGQPVPPPALAATNDDTAAARVSSASAAERNLVPQPQTYMGTLPCFAPGLSCEAQRITLTLAPNGRWRGRSAYLDNGPDHIKPIAEQGCWEVTREHPPRIFLIGADGNTRAEFLVAANNVLRLRSIDGITPNLNYTLTRQPDMDPINELAKQPAPRCPS